MLGTMQHVRELRVSQATRRIGEDARELRPYHRAVEGFPRRYAIVSTTRFITQDTEIAGVAIEKGDRQTVSTIAPRLDLAEFAKPFDVDVERTPNRHVAFHSARIAAWGLIWRSAR